MCTQDYLLRVGNSTPTLPPNSFDSIQVKIQVVSIMAWSTAIKNFSISNNKKLGCKKAQKLPFPSLNKQGIGHDGELTA